MKRLSSMIKSYLAKMKGLPNTMKSTEHNEVYRLKMKSIEHNESCRDKMKSLPNIMKSTEQN